MPDDDLLPDLASAVVESLPGGALVGVLLDRATRAVQSEWRRNLSTSIGIATARAGMSRADLDELLEREPRLVPLVVRVLHAAGMNGHDKTLKLLGGFLGEALSDTSHIDDVSLMLSAIEDMTEHHIKVLEILESPLDSHAAIADVGESRWTTGLLAHVSNMRPEFTLVATQGLVNAGFVRHAGIDGGTVRSDDLETGGTVLQITQLGGTVLEVLRAVASE